MSHGERPRSAAQLGRGFYPGGVCVALLALRCLTAQAAELYSLDGHDTRVAFNVERFGMRWISAQFGEVAGEVMLDREHAASRIDVSVQTESVDAHDARWNRRLRSSDWLDTARFPQMSFHSDRIQFDGVAAIATGRLTLHGITNPMVLDIGELSCADERGASRCSFRAHARIKRSNFGLPHGLLSGGDEVEIVLSGVGIRVAAAQALPARD